MASKIVNAPGKKTQKGRKLGNRKAQGKGRTGETLFSGKLVFLNPSGVKDRRQVVENKQLIKDSNVKSATFQGPMTEEHSLNNRPTRGIETQEAPPSIIRERVLTSMSVQV